MFLSRAERDYLLGATDQINHDYYCVKSRLVKKLKVFAEQELPLLLQKGYLAEYCKLPLAEDCKNDKKRTGPRGFDPLTCGSEDRRDILTTLRAQQAC
jgi:hypothetical protein